MTIEKAQVNGFDATSGRAEEEDLTTVETGSPAEVAEQEQEQVLPLPEGSEVAAVIGVIGAKGGVGTTALAIGLAKLLAGRGHRIGLLDADIASPDAYFRLAEGQRYSMKGDLLLPLQPQDNLQLMSFGGVMESPDEPMLWHSALMAGTALEFWGSTIWNKCDLLIVDLPTGGGDLTGQLLQQLPFDSIYLVSTPDQETLKRAEQVRNYLDWSGAHCGGLLVNDGLGRPVDGSPKVAATRMGLPLLDRVDQLSAETLEAPLWCEAVEQYLQ